MYLSHLAPGSGEGEITRNEDKVEGRKEGRKDRRKEEKRGEKIFTQSKNKDKDIIVTLSLPLALKIEEIYHEQKVLTLKILQLSP